MQTSLRAREELELQRREKTYRGDRPLLDVQGKSVLLVDDGLATGSTMRAAIKRLRLLSPKRIAVAVPVAPASTRDVLQNEADEIICAKTPPRFRAIGLWYDDFGQTTDEEVRLYMDAAAREQAQREAGQAPSAGI
ncbi:MAG: phosphoribosyltransferase family protein [Myxococcaceae bacterium]